MGMGGPSDHPITDLVKWGYNPFPADIADMILALHALDPKIRDVFARDAYDWAAGEKLEEGRTKLRAELKKHGKTKNSTDNT
jgi:hypothetical protein